MEFEENIYYDQLESPDKFNVAIVANPSAEKCNLTGEYEFHINAENFAIVDKVKNKRLYTWPFRYVRRYGKSSTNFQFEAGRKCESGEGLFSILTRNGDSEKIFDLVQTKFQYMKKRDRELTGEQEAKSSSEGNKAAGLGVGPALPVRSYENSNIPSSPTGVPHKRQNSKPLNKPLKPPKPGSVRKAEPHSIPANPQPESASASQINKLIGKNKDTLLTVDPNSTYSVIGMLEPAADTAAQYSAVYSQKAAPMYNSNDDTYAEVQM